MSDLKVRICQINNSIGDFDGNYQKIIEEVKKSEEENCDLAVFCEMTLSGYPCEDLWQKEYFISEAEKKIKLLCQETKNYNCAILLGAAECFDCRTVRQSVCCKSTRLRYL